jgi:aryl-alcohol dehydrogenase-like predicted oxidoreductase
MRLTGRGIWGLPKDPQSARQVLQRAVELGVNFIDTADSYGPEVNESLIAQALHPYPAGLVIATKGGLVRPAPDRWDPKADPAHLRHACEGSLQRLRVERIDLYQLHVPDPRVAIEESLQELGRLQQEGKIRHIGVSNFSVSQLQRAAKVVKVVSVQNRYNISDRGSDDVIDYCERQQMAFIPYFPLAAGDHEQSSQLRTLSKQHRITPAQAGLAWLLGRSPIMLPIPGTSSLEHLEENVAAASIKL